MYDLPNFIIRWLCGQIALGQGLWLADCLDALNIVLIGCEGESMIAEYPTRDSIRAYGFVYIDTR